MRNPVYIAGPYGAKTPAAIRRNVARAVALGRFAASCGLTPIVPHAMGMLGVFGDPWEEGDGRSRTTALECGEALAGAIGAIDGPNMSDPEGFIWTILRDDDTESFGTALETAAFGEWGNHCAHSWADWIAVYPSLGRWSKSIEEAMTKPANEFG